MSDDPVIRTAELQGWHPQDVLCLRDPALDELLGVHLPAREDGTPVGIREDNNRRAGSALLAFNAYSEHCHGDSAEPIDDGITDLLTDLLHLCDLLELDFAALEDKARGHYQSELEGIS